MLPRRARSDGVSRGVAGHVRPKHRQASKERRRSVPTRSLRIVHRPSGQVLAEGPPGWGITRFEGNYYVRRKYLRTSALKAKWVPGVCLYKGLYVWLDLRLPDERRVRNLGWFYWLPNPLLPFVAFRVAFDGGHSDLLIEESEAPQSSPHPRWRL